jgi:hypothetical protein
MPLSVGFLPKDLPILVIGRSYRLGFSNGQSNLNVVTRFESGGLSDESGKSFSLTPYEQSIELYARSLGRVRHVLCQTYRRVSQISIREVHPDIALNVLCIARPRSQVTITSCSSLS